MVKLENAEVLFGQFAAELLLTIEDCRIEGRYFRMTTNRRGIGPDDDDFALPDPRLLRQDGFGRCVGEFPRDARVESDIDLEQIAFK